MHTYSILYTYVFVFQELMKYGKLKTDPVWIRFVFVFLQGHKFLQSYFNTDLT